MNRLKAWKSIVSEWRGCTKCGIGREATCHVFGRGDLNAEVVFIGIGPGKEEDVFGAPFVGPSGRLLDEAIRESGLGEHRIFITNLISCRPVQPQTDRDRDPSNQEIQNCRERLERTVRLVNPKVIVAVGEMPQGALKSNSFATETPYEIFALTHPSHILRHGGKGSALYQRWLTHLQEIKAKLKNDENVELTK